MIETLTREAIELLKTLIKTPSVSGEEAHTAGLLENWFKAHGIPFQRKHHNLWATNRFFDSQKPTVLLNSHHDTVKPNKAYSRDPFDAVVEDGKLFGLGSNDAGASLVSLMAAFAYFYDKPDLDYNLLMLASAEEENSGGKGIRSVIPDLPEIDFAIVGEPTSMQMAVAEKGLLVLDCYAHGTPGHAAHQNNDNALYKAVDAVNWFRKYTFPKKSELLGPVKMTVTQINAGKQHNVVPSTCHFVVDIRVNDLYSNNEVLDLIKANVSVEVNARSLKNNSSSIPPDHPIVKAGVEMNMKTYGSPTLSDQAALSCPSLKLGPGDSLRSHSADEFVYLSEIEKGIEKYITLLGKILNELTE